MTPFFSSILDITYYNRALKPRQNFNFKNKNNFTKTKYNLLNLTSIIDSSRLRPGGRDLSLQFFVP